MRRNRPILAAALLGGACGMRTLTPPALLVARGRLTRSRPLGAMIALAAIGELIGDKLPSTPSRTAPLPLIGRMASGAICGASTGGAAGAGVATVTSAAATVLMHDARAAAVKVTGLPDLPFALIEDAIAVSVAAYAGRPGPPAAP